MTPLLSLFLLVAAPPPVHLWHEPEWFTGVNGGFAYWTGTAKPTGSWGIAGPGISAEWTQGGESEWNSIGVAAAETKASCYRDLEIPRAGKYHVWVRYVDHRRKKTPFRVVVESGGKAVLDGVLGDKPVVPLNDEYALYWGFSFGWGKLAATLPAGPARLKFVIDRAGEEWRQIDAVLITDDLTHEPVGREKPAFDYLTATDLRPTGPSWRGAGVSTPMTTRPKVGGRDFAMWTGIDGSPAAWKDAKMTDLSPPEVFRRLASPPDIRKEFLAQYPTPKDAGIVDSPLLIPGVYLGQVPDLSPGSALRTWLERTKAPFYIMTNYAAPAYTDKTGPATYAALTGPLAPQFLGYIHGEAVGTVSITGGNTALGKTRGEHLSAYMNAIRAEQAKEWTKFYKTPVPEAHRAKSIPCLSVESTALAHAFFASGCTTVGYEADATNVHVPMRIAFLRGAARQYGGAWINYASGNFGDACNYFTQEPRVPRGAKGWWHSKYATTDGVSASWYRKMYFVNHLSGASGIYWEQSLENQWLLPGPGTHKIRLSPFGRVTEDFLSFAKDLPDRGEPVTPVAFLLSRGHGYEPVSNHGKMLVHFAQSRSDIELRELFNVAWHPVGVVEGKPAAPDVQSMPSGVHGNAFDVLVDDPAKAAAIKAYPVLWAAGDVDLSGKWADTLREYIAAGGTLVVSAEQAKALPAALTGLALTGKVVRCETWTPGALAERAATPFDVAESALKGATTLAAASKGVPLLTRHAVGKGAVIVGLVPRMIGADERAHPALAYLMNGVMQNAMPVKVTRADGTPLRGEVMYQVNRTAKGYVVMLANNDGIDKTQHGVARVDRRKSVVVRLSVPAGVKGVRELTQGVDVAVDAKTRDAAVRVHPGDVAVLRVE